MTDILCETNCTTINTGLDSPLQPLPPDSRTFLRKHLPKRPSLTHAPRPICIYVSTWQAVSSHCSSHSPCSSASPPRLRKRSRGPFGPTGGFAPPRTNWRNVGRTATINMTVGLPTSAQTAPAINASRSTRAVSSSGVMGLCARHLRPRSQIESQVTDSQ